MLFTHTLLLTSTLAAGTAFAASLHSPHYLDTHSPAFRKRQEFSPTPVTCGVGNTCAESCGAGYILCSDPTTFLCYNPDIGQSCCGTQGDASAWACPSQSFCLIDGFCCPDGEDANTCAASNGVTLPATFTATTATPAPAATGTVTTTPAAVIPTTTPPASNTTAGFATYSPTAPAISTFTGAASSNQHHHALGKAGLLGGVVAVLGQII